MLVQPWKRRVAGSRSRPGRRSGGAAFVHQEKVFAQGFVAPIVASVPDGSMTAPERPTWQAPAWCRSRLVMAQVIGIALLPGAARVRHHCQGSQDWCKLLRSIGRTLFTLLGRWGRSVPD